MTILAALLGLFFIADICAAVMAVQTGGLGILIAVLVILGVIFHGIILFTTLLVGVERRKKEETET